MMGSEDNKGLIPRLCDALFERINASGRQSDYKVEVSYMEIYNEKVHDLLDPKGYVCFCLFIFNSLMYKILLIIYGKTCFYYCNAYSNKTITMITNDN